MWQAKMAHQQVLVDLQVAIILSQVSRSMQRGKALVIPMIDFSSQIEQVVYLQ